MEVIDNVSGRYAQTFSINGMKGLCYISANADKPQLDVSIYLLDTNDIKCLRNIVMQLRRMFYLDADMNVIQQY